MLKRKSVALCVSFVLMMALLGTAESVGATPGPAWVQDKGQGKATRGIPERQNKAPQSDPSTRRVTGSTTTTSVAIPFQTLRRDTDMLYVGQQHVLTYGVEGVLQRQTTVEYVDGHKVGSKVTERVTRKPVAQVVLVGTRVRPQTHGRLGLSGRSESGFDIVKSLTVVATAYVGGGRTATGVVAQPGVIAVDPSVIPLGTKVYIPGVGVLLAEDTGGAIRGNRIDICMSSLWQADQWGIRTIQIYEIH